MNTGMPATEDDAVVEVPEAEPRMDPHPATKAIFDRTLDLRRFLDRSDGDPRALACARTKLDELEMWVERAYRGQ